MAITYTWKITSLKVKNISDTMPNAVVQTNWQKIGTDENGNQGIFSGATPFTRDPTDESGPFIAFEELTEEDVINWIKTVVVGQYEQHVNEQIQRQISEKLNPTSEPPLPWASPINPLKPVESNNPLSES